MTSHDSRIPTRRRVLAALGASVVMTGLAGCSGDGNDGNGDAGVTDNGETPPKNGADNNANDGIASPEAAVEAYIQAGQDDDSEAMSAVVHPDGTAVTSPNTDEESTGAVSVNSVSVVEESDHQATVEVKFDLTNAQNDEQQTRTAVTAYEVRTHEGDWFIYSVSEPSFQNGSNGDDTDNSEESDLITPPDDNLGDPSGTVAENRIDELIVVKLDSFVANGHEHASDDRFTVEVTLGNNGNQSTDLEGYIYSLEVTDSDGETFYSRIRSATMDGEVSPGETGTIALWDWDGTDPSFFDSYALNINCSAASADGVYCSDS